MNFPAELRSIATHGGPEGQLGVLEGDYPIPFEIRRSYFIYKVPDQISRGSHAHKALEQFMIAVSGSFEVVLNDGNRTKVFELDSPAKGLYIRPGLWRDLKNFTPDAVCLVYASKEYSEADYLRDYEEFLQWVESK